MRKRTLLLLGCLAIISLTPNFLKASTPADTLALLKQDSINIRSLIISEVGSNWRGYNEWGYMELANTGTTTLDLSNFFIFNPNWGRWNEPLIHNIATSVKKMTLFGTLEPGKTFLLVQRERNLGEDAYGVRNYPNGYTNYEADRIADYRVLRWEAPLTDPTIIESELVQTNMGLMYRNQVTEYNDSVYPDSIFIDRFGTVQTEGNAEDFPISGIVAEQPWRARYYVRKYTVKEGNVLPKSEDENYNENHVTKWDRSRGTDIADSEWLPLPRQMEREYSKIFTTIGNHGDNPEYSVTSSVPGVNIDTEGEMITMPFGVSRDSVFRLFETGINHAWELKMGADTGQFFVQADDSVFFYTVGSELVTKKYGLTITKDENKVALVAPLVYKNNDDAFTRRYNISSGEEPIDTIGTLPYDLEVDTFFTYMVKEEGASWEIIPADGQKRPEIKEGDKLKVTSNDGTVVKEYYLGVDEFFPSHNANLSSVYFPGLELWENPETFMPTDTLINFIPNGTVYTIKLPSDITISPAVVASKEDSRARVEVKRAKDIRGSEDGRTARIIVTAEDDTTTKEYKIIFNVERESPPVQGSLFITDIATGWAAPNQNRNLQFFNPSDDLVDLTDYALVIYKINQFDAIANNYKNDSAWKSNNEAIFRFGSIVEPAEDGTPVFKTDLVQDKILLEPKETFSIATRGAYGPAWVAPEKADDVVDLVLGHFEPSDKVDWWTKSYLKYAQYKYGSTDPWGSGYLPWNGFGSSTDFRNIGNSWARVWFGIAKIVNDSVKDGTKHVFGDFYNDYEWVDHVGGPSRTTAMPFYLYENDTIINAGKRKGQNAGLYRKPSVYRGEPIESKSFGIADDVTLKTYHESEWVWYGLDFSEPDPSKRVTVNRNDEGTGLMDVRDARIKNHIMITYAHISYLTSSVYLLEEGLTGAQDIAGVTAGTTVAQFLGNVDKADTGMVVKVFSADGTTPISGSDPIVAGTQVWSWSANGLDSVNYVISKIGALDNDCTLSSTDYSVTKDGASGNVSGIKIGTTLEQILEKVSIPSTASIMFTDGKEGNLPLYKYNADTMDIQTMKMAAVLASDKVFIEVIAQDNITNCVYSLAFDTEDDPFLLSDVYVVDNTEKVINFVWRTSPANLLANLIPSPGASIKVVNKYDQERALGVVVYSDRVILTKEGKEISYWLKFSSEEEIIGVQNNEIELENLQVYPNPTTDFVTIKGLQGKFYEIRGLTGKLILKQKITAKRTTIDLRKLNSGIYIIKDDKASYKVIKN